MNIKEVFGTNLRKYRTEKGFSQEKFADFIVLILAILNAFNAMYHLRTFKKLRKRWILIQAHY